MQKPARLWYDATTFDCGAQTDGTAFGGARGRSQVPGLIDRYMNGDILVDELITDTIPLEKINEAFEEMHKDSGYRYVVQI